MAEEDVRVLSIQSHVVVGYVGNRSACFPLQALGFDVAVINSVQFSNHTGYGAFAGQRLSAAGLIELVDGMEKNGLLRFTHLLTGYVGSAEFLEALLQVIQRLRAVNPDLVYVCDPVLGDNGKLYVPAELVGVFRDRIITQAQIITPNQFEVEQLTGLPCATEGQALAAIAAFHARGIHTVVITSAALGDKDESHLNVIGSTKDSGPFSVVIPRLQGTFTGTGDLFAALLLAWTHKLPRDLAGAVRRTLSTIHAVLERTLAHAGESRHMRDRELRLVQSLDDILHPPLERYGFAMTEL